MWYNENKKRQRERKHKYSNGGTMTNKWGKWILITMTGMIMFTGCGNDPKPLPDVTPSPAQQKHAIMENAFALGETVFYYDAEQTKQFALFYGGERIVYIKSRIIRTVKLTSNECINLEIRSRDDNGDWNFVYAMQNVSPGDYVKYDGSWRVTPYTQ